MAKDNKTVSEQPSEIYTAKKRLKVNKVTIAVAKSIVGNDREAVYKWVNENRGKTIGVVIE